MFSVQSCANSETDEIVNCFEQNTDMEVAKIDERNHRIFAIPELNDEELIVSQVKLSKKCFSSSSWSNDWTISFFTHPKYAGYKDEKNIIQYHKNNEWTSAYIGEYNGPSETYTSFPAGRD